MKQYCRYCADCSMQDDDVFICVSNGNDNAKYGHCMNSEQIRRINKCKLFIFNEIAVDNFDVTYKPQEHKEHKTKIDNQISFLEGK